MTLLPTNGKENYGSISDKKILSRNPHAKTQISNGPKTQIRYHQGISPQNQLSLNHDLQTKASANSHDKTEGGSLGNRRRLGKGLGSGHVKLNEKSTGGDSIRIGYQTQGGGVVPSLGNDSIGKTARRSQKNFYVS